VIAIDSNILIYAHRAESDWHKPASRLIRQLAEGETPWCIPWPCIHEFLAIVTHPRIYKPATLLADAIRQVNFWSESPSLRLIGETDDHWKYLHQVLSDGKVTGPAIHDARIVAIALQHGIKTLWSADRDFGRFRHIKIENPLTRVEE
jgi:uncharacterized protein